MNYLTLSERILSLDSGIRYVVITNQEGDYLADATREDADLMLSREEMVLSITQSLIRMNIRLTLEGKLGRPLYSFTEYENIKRATIVCYNNDDYEKRSDIKFIVVLVLEKQSRNETTLLSEVVKLIYEVKDLTDTDTQ